MVAINDAGTAVVAWRSRARKARGVHVAIFRDGRWSAAETFGDWSTPADVAIDRGGNVVVVWTEPIAEKPGSGRVMAAYRPAGGSWSAPRVLHTSDAWPGIFPRGAVHDAERRARRRWQRYCGLDAPTGHARPQETICRGDRQHARRRHMVGAAASRRSSSFREFDLAVASTGDAIVVWSTIFIGGTSGAEWLGAGGHGLATPSWWDMDTARTRRLRPRRGLTDAAGGRRPGLGRDGAVDQDLGRACSSATRSRPRAERRAGRGPHRRTFDTVNEFTEWIGAHRLVMDARGEASATWRRGPPGHSRRRNDCARHPRRGRTVASATVARCCEP